MTTSPSTWLLALPVDDEVATAIPTTLEPASVRAIAYGRLKSCGFRIAKTGDAYQVTRTAQGVVDASQKPKRQPYGGIIPPDQVHPRPGMSLDPPAFQAALAAMEDGDSLPIPDSVDHATVTRRADRVVVRTPDGWRVYTTARADDAPATRECRRLAVLDSIEHALSPGAQDLAFTLLFPRQFVVRRGVKGVRIWRTR